MSRNPPTTPRTWLLRLIAAVAIPVLLLLALESGLRLAGYGKPTTFLIPDSKPGYFRTNPEFAGLFLPGNFDLRPLNFRVSARKGARNGADHRPRRVRRAGCPCAQLRVRVAAAGPAQAPLSGQGHRGAQHRDRRDQLPRHLPDRARARPFRTGPVRGLHGQQRGGRTLRTGLRVSFADAAALGDPGERVRPLDEDRPAPRGPRGKAGLAARQPPRMGRDVDVRQPFGARG